MKKTTNNRESVVVTETVKFKFIDSYVYVFRVKPVQIELAESAMIYVNVLS